MKDVTPRVNSLLTTYHHLHLLEFSTKEGSDNSLVMVTSPTQRQRKLRLLRQTAEV